MSCLPVVTVRRAVCVAARDAVCVSVYEFAGGWLVELPCDVCSERDRLSCVCVRSRVLSGQSCVMEARRCRLIRIIVIVMHIRRPRILRLQVTLSCMSCSTFAISTEEIRTGLGQHQWGAVAVSLCGTGLLSVEDNTYRLFIRTAIAVDSLMPTPKSAAMYARCLLGCLDWLATRTLCHRNGGTQLSKTNCQCQHPR